METKKCLYCGEEILAVAKKCKYCGNWLDKTAVKTEKKMMICPACAEEIEDGLKICPLCKEEIVQENVVSSSKSKSNYWLLSMLCYVAMGFEIIYLMHASGILESINKGSEYGIEINYRNDMLYIIQFLAEYIPEWLALICCGGFWVFLLVALRKYYITKCPNQPSPFIILICLSIVMYSLSLYLIFTENLIFTGFYYSPILIKLIRLLITILFSIFIFSIGLKLKKNLKEKGITLVSIMMIVMAIVIPIISILENLLIYSDDVSWIAFIKAGAIVTFYSALIQLFKKEKAKLKELKVDK